MSEKPSRFARFHSQTYEMELLVSGALTFGLLQAPGYLNGQFARAIQYVDGGLRLLVVYGFVYVSLAVMALLVFFGGNLLLRAFWVGLVGLESVFPGGIDWGRLKLGPHTHRVLQARLPPLSVSIEHLDSVCSLLFSLAFLIVQVMAFSIAAIALWLALAWGVGVVTPWPAEAVFWVLFLCFFAFTLATSLVDKHLGAKLTPGGRADRLLGALVRANLRISPLRFAGSVPMVLQSRLTEKRTNLLIAGSMAVISVLFLGSLLLREGFLRGGSLIYLPEDAGSAGVEAKSYRGAWGPDDFAVASWRPSIDTDVVSEPFVRLFLPYRPASHNGRMAQSCPGVKPSRSAGLAFGRPPDPPPAEELQQGLGCFVGLFRLQLDGQPLGPQRWDWYTEPTQRIPGALAYLDVRHLAPGRHELVIDTPRGTAPQAPEEEDLRRQVVIPFWR